MKKARPMAALLKSARGQKATRPTLPIGVPGVGRQGNRAAWVDARLKHLTASIEEHFFEVVELADEVVREGYHARYRYVDAERYLEDRLGHSYRSIARRRAVVKLVQSMPPETQARSRALLVSVGSHKASILVPAIRKDPTGLEAWVKTAQDETVAGLQAKVSRVLESKPRGAEPDAPGARWLAYTLNQVPPDTREEVEAVFKLGETIAESDNAVQVFLCMVREVKVEWDHRATA